MAAAGPPSGSAPTLGRDAPLRLPIPTKSSGKTAPPVLGMIPEEQTRTVSQAELHDLIVEDHLEAPPEADPASAVASRCVRTVVFFVFCQAVQCFMSYDGGATPASLDTIQEEMDGAWDPSEFGILGSIDKVGMTATSIIWGRSLQLCNVKLLLCTGLLINGLCTAAFGSLRSKWMMYLAKLLMGATQSLQGVWGTVWTVTMAPPDRKTLWLGLGGVSVRLLLTLTAPPSSLLPPPPSPPPSKCGVFLCCPVMLA
ncbi:unnamed protein product, partial [Prorocentrum cordatum]